MALSTAQIDGGTKCLRQSRIPAMTKDLDQDAIGRRIALVRQKHGNQSQTEFAKSVGINRTTLGNYETGYNRPRIDHAVAICDKYNLTLDWFYLGKKGGMRLQDLEFLGIIPAED